MSDETTCRTCGGEDGFRVTKGGVVVSDEQAAFDKKLMHFITAVKEGDTGPFIYGIYLFIYGIYLWYHYRATSPAACAERSALATTEQHKRAQEIHKTSRSLHSRAFDQHKLDHGSAHGARVLHLVLRPTHQALIPTPVHARMDAAPLVGADCGVEVALQVNGANRRQTGHDLCTDQTRDESEQQLAGDVHLAVGGSRDVAIPEHGREFAYRKV